MSSVREEPIRVAVIGDRQPRFVAQETIDTALAHSGAELSARVDVDWFPTPALVDDATDALDGYDAVWCAPGSPFLSFEGALAGIRVARESGRPFLGTCAGFQHGVIEFARNVLDIRDAHHAEYEGADAEAPLIIDELLCSLVGQQMAVRLVDPVARGWYGADDAVEQYYCRFGLNESYVPAFADAGLVVAGVADEDGTTRIMRVADHPFFALTLFVPQAASTESHPHPIVTAYITAALDARIVRS
jgi:CTP synthase (UTP-ammonia lyase)